MDVIKRKNKNLKLHLCLATLLTSATIPTLGMQASGHNPANNKSIIYSGIPWFDDQGKIINAHGACIVQDGGRYWLFGEYKSDISNAFPGFGCYSSEDMVNWKFERVVLPVQKDGILGPNRVGERVKVMRCPKTGEYVMLMHADNLKYGDPYIGIATCKTINGDYELHGPLLYNGNPIKRWDMGTFQDTDGKGYLLTHHGPIYLLSDDYRSVVAQVANVQGMGESPAMIKKDGVYFLLTSNLTNWERNDNYYLTAPHISGPWTRRTVFCPKGTLTYNSQSTFVFPIVHGNDTIPMYMGDRWSYPHQASAATYVWQPMKVEGTKLSIPEYWEAWDAKTVKQAKGFKGKTYYNKLWKSNRAGDVLAIPFRGSQVAIYGETDKNGGYAEVIIKRKDGTEIHRSYVDFYSLVPDKALKFISRSYPKDDYILEVKVSGEMPVSFDKKGNRFGSIGTNVVVSKVVAK